MNWTRKSSLWCLRGNISSNSFSKNCIIVPTAVLKANNRNCCSSCLQDTSCKKSPRLHLPSYHRLYPKPNAPQKLLRTPAGHSHPRSPGSCPTARCWLSDCQAAWEFLPEPLAQPVCAARRGLSRSPYSFRLPHTRLRFCQGRGAQLQTSTSVPILWVWANQRCKWMQVGAAFDLILCNKIRLWVKLGSVSLHCRTSPRHKVH